MEEEECMASGGNKIPLQLAAKIGSSHVPVMGVPFQYISIDGEIT
jgi:hypothetical protein